MNDKEKFVMQASKDLLDAVIQNKKAGFSKSAIMESVSDFFDDAEIYEYIFPENAGWVEHLKNL